MVLSVSLPGTCTGIENGRGCGMRFLQPVVGTRNHSRRPSPRGGRGGAPTPNRPHSPSPMTKCNCRRCADVVDAAHRAVQLG